MSKFLVERLGAGSYKVGSIVELTDSEALFYASKIRRLPDTGPEKLEVATPKTKTKKAAN